ncbi:MAG: alpha-L-fucosidase [Treponema lecithinolyticum]|uniref:alpha-L-fucosidase n=1 Tax=Treponema lecithinolyticum TaxID=53418 RepID=UPI0036198279
MKTSLYTDERLKAIECWQNLQFGMFIHFGLYSLAGGCWNGKPVKKGYCEQILSHGNIPQADYEALVHEFRVPHFNAELIAETAKKAGMRYLVITSKHHDGFCLFDTKTTDYNSVRSACKRDIVAELAAACKKNGVAFGVYFSLIDWHCPWALPISSHNSDRIPEKHHAYNLAQLTELMTNYGDICELWLDMGHPTRQQSQEMYDLVHGLQKSIMINGRIWNDKGDFATMADNEMPELPLNEYELNVPWQTPASIYKETWGYKSWQERTDAQGKIRNLTESLRRVVSHGGNYLLNIGPDNEGNIVPFEKEVLEGIGRSLKDAPLPVRDFTASKSDYEARHLPLIKAEKDGSFILNTCTKLFRYTGEEYYDLRAIVTGKRWRLETPPENGERRSYILGWACDAPLKEDVKLCFEDDNQRLYFSLAKGKTSGIISTNYRLPEPAGAHDGSGSAGAHGGPGAQCAVLELSTVGNPLERPELPVSGIRLTLDAVDATAG